MADTSDRTVPATPRRREAARRAGAMPAATAPAWAAAAATTILLLPAWLRATVPAAADLLRATLPATQAPAPAALLPPALLLPTLGLVLASGAAGLAVRFALDGFTWQPGRIAPSLRRVDPRAGVARVLSVRSLLGALGHGLGLALLVAVAWRGAAPFASLAASGDTLDDPGRLVAAAWWPLAWIATAAAVVAAIQWGLARRRFEAELRMTPQEFADETRGLQADRRVRLSRDHRDPRPVRRPDGPPAPSPAAAPRSRSGR